MISRQGSRNDGSGLTVQRVLVGAFGCALLAVALVDPASGQARRTPLIDCVSSDNGDPVLTALTISPEIVDVTRHARTVTLAALVSDTGGPGSAVGTRKVVVTLAASHGEPEDVVLTRSTSGNWTGQVRIDRWTRPGRWRVQEIRVRDRAGNVAQYGYAARDLAALPVDHGFTVIAGVDHTKPTLTHLGISPGAVNTLRHPGKLTVTARADDARSGVRFVFVELAASTGHGSESVPMHGVRDHPHMYRGQVIMRKWIGSATWQVRLAGAMDRAGNFRLYQAPGALRGLGPHQTVRVVSAKDQQPPTLIHLNPGPAVDVRVADQTVNVAVRVRDARAGVRRVLAYVQDAQEFYPLVKLSLQAGTGRDGIWRGSFTVSECPAESGTLRLFVSVQDARGNGRGYSPRRLERLGLRSTIEVRARADAIMRPARIQSEQILPDDPAVVRFGEPVSGITNASTAVRRVSRTEGEPPGPRIAGRWACATTAGMSTSCATGLVRTASFTPSAAFEPRNYYEIRLNPEHWLAITDRAGNPFDRDVVGFKVRPSRRSR